MAFTYYTQSKLVFGVGAEAQLENLLKENHATSVLLVYSGEYVFDLGIYDVVDRAVRDLGATLIETGEVVPNPRIDLVRATIEQARAAKIDFILAVGGASSFDTAKAIGSPALPNRLTVFPSASSLRFPVAAPRCLIARCCSKAMTNVLWKTESLFPGSRSSTRNTRAPLPTVTRPQPSLIWRLVSWNRILRQRTIWNRLIVCLKVV